MRRLAPLLTLISLLAVPATAAAADFNPAPGTYAVNTTTLKITGPGGTNITGVDQGGVATFSFGTVNIRSGVILNASGTRPFKLAALGNLTVTGIINGNGVGAANFTVAANAGGPGGGAGSSQFANAGSGPGGGASGPSSSDGGGGGGFGGGGARGGSGGGGSGAGGGAYGNLDATLQGGSGGGGGASTGGGGGGGAIGLFGKVVTITSTGQVHADGGGGGVGFGGASAGGSGGSIFLHGNVVDNRGQLTARGGDGGAGGCCGDGGGGGGGRVAFRYTSRPAAGTPNVSGGTSGIRGGLAHGGLSPDATGANGVVTQTVGTRVINFDDATTAPCCFSSTNALTERYAGMGVHFAGPVAGGGGAILNESGSFGVNGHSSPNFLAFNTVLNYTNGKPASGPETITFDTPISTATINTGQGTGGTATLTAFKGTQVVGSAFRTSTAALSPLTVSGEHITRLTLTFTGSAIVFDDLRWNTEPVSRTESFSVSQNGQLNVGARGVLANDTDADGDPLTASLASDRAPAHGTVSVRPDGGFTYTPASGFSGMDSFGYNANDGDGNGNAATVSITVDPLPPPPPAPPPPPPPPPPPTLLASTVSNGWLAFVTYTTPDSLAVNSLPPGATVKVTCKTKKKRQQKKSCPYKSKTFKTGTKTRLSLLKPFRKRKLPVGTKVTIRITAPGFIGKQFTYTMRKRKKPKLTRQCIPPGGKPGKC
jgi:hypothetical protein